MGRVDSSTFQVEWSDLIGSYQLKQPRWLLSLPQSLSAALPKSFPRFELPIFYIDIVRPIIMVIVEIENGLYGIMYGPALESVEKEAKNSLATRNELEIGFHFRSEYVDSGEFENQLMCTADQQGRSSGALEVCP